MLSELVGRVWVRLSEVDIILAVWRETDAELDQVDDVAELARMADRVRLTLSVAPGDVISERVAGHLGELVVDPVSAARLARLVSAAGTKPLGTGVLPEDEV